MKKRAFPLLPLSLAFALLIQPLPATEQEEEAPVELPKVTVSTAPVISFPIALNVRVDPKTRKIFSVVITKIVPNSEAEQLGLQPGDEIVKVNGKPVSGMDGRISIEGELAKMLLNRPRGERLHLEVVTRQTKAVTLHATPP